MTTEFIGMEAADDANFAGEGRDGDLHSLYRDRELIARGSCRSTGAALLGRARRPSAAPLTPGGCAKASNKEQEQRYPKGGSFTHHP